MSKTFKSGTVIVWDGPNKFNPGYWNNLPEVDRLKYYSCFGYGSVDVKRFVYLCDINANGYTGHGVILELGTNKIISMIHPSEFRAVTEDEF